MSPCIAQVSKFVKPRTDEGLVGLGIFLDEGWMEGELLSRSLSQREGSSTWATMAEKSFFCEENGFSVVFIW